MSKVSSPEGKHFFLVAGVAIPALALFSGVNALIFEVLWTRLLSTILGSTGVAMTCTFSVFILCLSLGAQVAGRVNVFQRRALIWYALIEAGVATSGFTLTYILLKYDACLAGTWTAASPSVELALKSTLSFLLMGLPTTLMGATLPVMLNSIRGFDGIRRNVTVIYGFNLLGGALGSLAAGFWLIWKLGILGTAGFAMGIGLVIAGASLAISRRIPESRTVPDGDRSETYGGIVPRGYGCLAFALGFLSFSYELLWGRISKLYLGDRTQATACLLFVYLSCLAIGSFVTPLFDRFFAKRSEAGRLTGFGLILALAAAAHLLSVSAIHWILAENLLASWMQASALSRAWLTLGLLVVPVSLMGISFPYLMSASPRLKEFPGHVLGRLYFANSLGCALGAFAGGILGPRVFGTGWSMVLASAGLFGLAGFFFVTYSAGKTRVAYALGTVVVAVLLGGLVPKAFHFYSRQDTMVDYAEDEYGIQVVTRNPEGHLKVKNNRLFIAYKLGLTETSFAQEMISYFSCMLAKHCDEVLNIGTGYGITAGAFTLMDAVKHLKTVEILPYLYRQQARFRDFNFGYYDDKRVTRVCGDGEFELLKTKKKYDIITVNVLGPYDPGSSTFFTTDFWEEAKARLNEGGVYSQLIWGPHWRILLKGLTQVFPQIIVVPGYSDALNVIAFPTKRMLFVHENRISKRVIEALARFGIRDKNEVKAFVENSIRDGFDQGVAMTSLANRVESPRLHSKNWPLLEYRWATGYEGLSGFDSLSSIDWN